MVDAHAPSRIVLEAREHLACEIVAGIRSGGVDRATCRIYLNDGAEFLPSIAAPNAMRLARGDRLSLVCDVEDKTCCWNYWAIQGTPIVPPASVVMGCGRPPHLGDALSLLCGLQQYAADNTIRASAVREPMIRDLLDLFEFPAIELTDAEATIDGTGLFSAIPWEGFWLRRFGTYLARRFGGRFGDNCYLPRPKRRPTEKENVVLCQFDSRSAAQMPSVTVRRLLSSVFHGRRIAAVGGLDTSPYLGTDFEYRRGTLAFVVDQLQRCQHFIGVDSGMAHLAGVLGTPSTVINLIDFRIVHSFFSGYPGTAVLDKDRLLELLGIDAANSL